MDEAEKTIKLDENHTSENPSIHDFYNFLKEYESLPADLDKKIFVGNITPEEPEYEKLINAGVSPEDIKKREIKRGKLLEAGFTFNNYPLYAIEKPLINMEINGIDFGKRKLITKDELEEIKKYQRQHPELYGTEDIEADEFREDMLRFLLTADPVLPNHVENKVNFYRLCCDRISSPYLTRESKARYENDKIPQKANPLYARLIELHRKNFSISDNPFFDEQEFVEENLQDVMPWDEPGEIFDRFRTSARGHKMMIFETRKTKLTGIDSPFLDSGFHFPAQLGNPDYTVKSSNGRLFRVNAMVLHLTSRGMSEMGEGNTGDGEQDYTIGNYIRDLAPKNAEEREKNQKQEDKKWEIKTKFSEEKQMKKVQDRLKELALIWADSEDAPKEAKQLAEQIRKIEDGNDVSRLQVLRKKLAKFF